MKKSNLCVQDKFMVFHLTIFLCSYVNFCTHTVLPLKSFHIRRSLFLITGGHHILQELIGHYSMFHRPAAYWTTYISMWRWWWWWRQIKTNMKNFNKNKYANFHEKYLWRCSAAFDDDDDVCDDDDDDNKDHLRKIR